MNKSRLKNQNGRFGSETQQNMEYLEITPQSREPYSTGTPESGVGILKPLCKAESAFNWFIVHLPIFGALLLFFIIFFISFDVLCRLFFHKPWRGITDLEMLFMSVIGFSSLGITIIQRQSMQIDLLYSSFSGKIQRSLYLLGCTLSCFIAGILSWRAAEASLRWTRDTGILEIPEWPVLLFTGIGLGLASVAFMFQVLHVLKSMLTKRELVGILASFACITALAALPFLYKFSGLKLSGMAVGCIGFILLLALMLLRVPLGWSMSAIGLLGLLSIVRRSDAALAVVGTIPFTSTATFMMIAFPMFMLMGEMVSLSGLSEDLFDAAQKWMGRLPGGLAVAGVGGCAGLGAVCGDSLATVITMSAVAMPAMRANGYDMALSTGSLAAGGTLGILIPPSIGFIVYSMITEESVGKLFVAGILPGVLLTAIFMGIIIIQVLRHPERAPMSIVYSLQEKLVSLLYLIPVIALFLVVVIGILRGWFTPAEGGALGAIMAFLYALIRGKITWANLKDTMLRTIIMFGKLFALFVGLYVLQAFLAASRLPNLMAGAVAGLEVNRYLVLLAIIVLYIVLGCLMNIMPMMMLTLPSIYPTVQALGFDGIWFGVVCVIIMEMGMITPPVGINVFTMASLQPDIPMATIFRGVMPFFFGMLLCVFLIILFPQIALFLGSP